MSESEPNRASGVLNLLNTESQTRAAFTLPQRHPFLEKEKLHQFSRTTLKYCFFLLHPVRVGRGLVKKIRKCNLVKYTMAYIFWISMISTTWIHRISPSISWKWSIFRCNYLHHLLPTNYSRYLMLLPFELLESRRLNSSFLNFLIRSFYLLIGRNPTLNAFLMRHYRFHPNKTTAEQRYLHILPTTDKQSSYSKTTPKPDVVHLNSELYSLSVYFISTQGYWASNSICL